MKSKRTTIPLALRSELEKDPEYKTCSLYGQEGHTCDGRITWEHAFTFAGRSLQQKWAIIPLCASGHSVDSFQDNGLLDKGKNLWVALSRATPDELRAVSKAIDYSHRLIYLNTLYGTYNRKYPPKKDIGPKDKIAGIIIDDLSREDLIEIVKSLARENAKFKKPILTYNPHMIYTPPTDLDGRSKRLAKELQKVDNEFPRLRFP